MTTTSDGRTARRRALICGVTGQDGAYLARHLIDQGYQVTGTSRDATLAKASGLKALKVVDSVTVVSMANNDFRSVLQVVSRSEPDEIYNLAGQSSVGLSFEQPVETIESIALGALNLLEAIRFVDRPIRFYNAGSSECFGNAGGSPANERTPFRPRSPYAVAKACAHNLVDNYREAYGIYACNGILFNHESPVRSETFVTRKITRAIARIALGLQDCLYLGNLSALRDWGHARDYVQMMWLMLQQDQPEDFVIATGVQYSVRQFVELAARELGVEVVFSGTDKQEIATVSRVSGDKASCKVGDVIVGVDPRYYRPTEVETLLGDATKAHHNLGWSPSTTLAELVREMVQSDYASAKQDDIMVKQDAFQACDSDEKA